MSNLKLNVSLSSRVFAVTGGASGIGAATVRLLAAQGAGGIWIADLNTDKLANIKEEVAEINPQTQVHTTKVNVTSSKEVDDWMAGFDLFIRQHLSYLTTTYTYSLYFAPIYTPSLLGVLLKHSPALCFRILNHFAR